jgi:hypothetical protein
MKEEKGGKLRRQLSRTYDLLRTTHQRQRAKIGAKFKKRKKIKMKILIIERVGEPPANNSVL